MCMLNTKEAHNRVRKNIVLYDIDIQRLSEIKEYLKNFKKRGVHSSFIIQRAITNYYAKISEIKKTEGEANFILKEVNNGANN